jgi:hypothetical protein
VANKRKSVGGSGTKNTPCFQVSLSMVYVAVIFLMLFLLCRSLAV